MAMTTPAPAHCTCIHEPETDAGHVLHASYCAAAYRDGQLAEQKHFLDLDTAFAAMAAACPEACSTAADYPNWTPGGAR